MKITEMYLAEFEHEAVTTRRFLEQLPADKLTWKPHEKSMTAGQLGLHIAESPSGIIQMAIPDVSAAPDFTGGPAEAKSLDQILKAHDQSVKIVKEILPSFSDEAIWATWRMTMNGQQIIAMPRCNMLRSFLLNHWIHHRGQFGVYLRLMGAKVPSSYGPVAMKCRISQKVDDRT